MMNLDFVVTKIERIALVGKEIYPEPHISFHPFLPCNELIFHFSGEATVLFDELILKTRRNTIRFLPKGAVSKYEVFHKSGDCILIDFQTDKPISQKAFVLDMPKNESIGALFKKIFARWATDKEKNYFECFSLLYKILDEINKENFNLTLHQKIIQPAINAINTDFLNDELTVPMLASMCEISETYFKKLFKERYNISPKKYIIQLKINHACELLQLKKYSIKQVAELCNYPDIYYFSKQFKDYMGITPTQFVKKYQSSK